MMSLFDRDGAAKLVPMCTYPLTAPACVTRVYTDRAVFLIQADGVHVRETFGTSLDQLAADTGLQPLGTATPGRRR